MTDGPTDRLTDLPTDTARCRVACPRLKMKEKENHPGCYRIWGRGRKGGMTAMPMILFCIVLSRDAMVEKHLVFLEKWVERLKKENKRKKDSGPRFNMKMNFYDY